VHTITDRSGREHHPRIGRSLVIDRLITTRRACIENRRVAKYLSARDLSAVSNGDQRHPYMSDRSPVEVRLMGGDPPRDA